MTLLRNHARATSAALLALATAAAPGLARADLGYAETSRLAADQAPTTLMQRLALDSARAGQPSAATLPDPRLSVGVDNLPLSGPDRLSLTRDFMTMQRFGVMQEVPNRAKRAARAAGAQAKVEREQANLAAARLTVQREAALAWLGVWFAEKRAAQLADLEREIQLLIDTLGARIAAGKSMPADLTMARQEALALADRRDDARRDITKARATLRRWVDARAGEPLAGEPPTITVADETVLAGLHQHTEIAPYTAMQAMAQAEAGEADADQRGDWSWEAVYSRRGPGYPDMVSFQVRLDLPWQRGSRQQPQIAARLKEVERLGAEREEVLRRHREEVEAQLAELQALDAQHDRLAGAGSQLSAERVTLALASYEAGRSDLSAVLGARREAVETRLRLIDLEAQRSALRVRLTTLIAE
ncbi:MAG: TolC family protein [Burkholderiales bacterium]|nr:TolC family protein [Burkholderiales bacterium]